MFRLYRYENWFYQITMSGKEVRTWLEYSASKVRANEDGTFSIQGGLTYYDVISGEGFSYEINAAAPSGHRIENMTYNGKAVQDTGTFTVVINNYRFNGGGNFIHAPYSGAVVSIQSLSSTAGMRLVAARRIV